MESPNTHAGTRPQPAPIDNALASLALPPSDLTDQLLDQGVLQALFGPSGDSEVRIGRYRLLGRLGRGASGVVYEAHDSELDRRVAIKAVTLSDNMSDLEIHRLRQEAPLLAQLTHPNIVTVYDVVIRPDALYMVMEKLGGDVLTRWLE